MVSSRPRDPETQTKYTLPLKTAEATTEILLSDLPTKKVTLAPGQATVVREIHTTIQPDQTDIAIIGLDPRVNRDSIRIEGVGAAPATITDIQSSFVPQRGSFEDAFPAESDSDDDSNSLSEDEEVLSDEEGLHDTILQELQNEIEQVNKKVAKAKGEINSSLAVLDILNTYGRGLSSDENKDVQKLEQFLELYTSRREREGERHRDAEREVAAKEKELAVLKKKFEKRKAQNVKERRKASKGIRLRNEKRARARGVKWKEKMQRRFERQHFWPASVGMVVVSLDTHTHSNALTPTSSRRSSTTNDNTNPIDITLLLSYIVPGPGWTPRYDLSMNSVFSLAQLTYRAEFRNSSTEIWRETSFTLSTSQASFSGIGEKIPSLDIWNIKLVSGFGASKTTAPSWDRILDAPNPSLLRPKASVFPAKKSLPAGGMLFGNATSQPQPATAQPGNPFGSTGARLEAQAQITQQSGGLFGSVSSRPQQSRPSSAQQQQQQQGGGLFGVRPQPQPQPQQAADNASGDHPAQASRPSLFGGGLFSALRNTSNQPHPEPEAEESKPSSTSIKLEDDDTETDNQSLTSTNPSFSHQNTLKQEHGLTTTYNLPGTRTLPPSLVSRRHVLATLDLNTVSLTYVIVPKHREAAFLRARVKNTSSLTLHPGTVGITVDGSFIGSANIEKCAPNIFFNISLGVDPGIEVKYSKPIVKPLSGGIFFNKEDGAKFRRSVWVKNSKSLAVDLVIADQVPVSEDEKLSVKLLVPRVEEEGAEVPIAMEKGKGEGTATLLKNGEMKWALRLEANQEVKLVLEYEARVPSGSDVACVSS
ncbi:hypothetical protein BDW69DRAFT_191893 [Aspergillus filifer]